MSKSRPFEILRDDDIEILHVLESRMSHDTLEQLQQEVSERIEAGCRRMVFNLAPVAFVDSFGIGIIVASARKMTQSGGQLKLCGVGERVRMSLTITRLDRALDIVPDEHEALRSLRGEA